MFYNDIRYNEVAEEGNLQILNFKFQISKSGFTIMEIMLVLVFVAIMLSGIIPLFLAVVRANTSTDYYFRAYKALDSQVEVYRRTAFDNLPALGTSSFPVTSTNIPGATGSVTVSNTFDGVPGQTDIKNLELTITWNDQKQNQVKINTYIYRNGLGK